VGAGAVEANPVVEGTVVGGHAGIAVGCCTGPECAAVGLERLAVDIKGPAAALVGPAAEVEVLGDERDGSA